MPFIKANPSLKGPPWNPGEPSVQPRGLQAMDEPPEPAGGEAAKKRRRRTKPLAGADNAPLRRRLASARVEAHRATSDAAPSEEWAQALIAACTIWPAGAPPAAAPPTSAGRLSGASTVCARGKPATHPTRPRVGQVVDRHAAGGFRHQADFMDTEPPGSCSPCIVLHAMPAARSALGSASGAPPSQAGEAGVGQAIQAMACLVQAGSQHSLASVEEQQEVQGGQAMPM